MAKREVDLGDIQGPEGPKGDTIFQLEVDTDGNLYAVYADGTTPPDFEYDASTGNLYLVVQD